MDGTKPIVKVGDGWIYAAHPSYAGGVAASGRAFWAENILTGSHKFTGKVTCVEHGGSLLAQTFNSFWCSALCLQEAGEEITHFAMLHDDIVPESGWLELLYEEIEACGADVLSAVVPLKDSYGLTSTAISGPDNPFIRERRLSLEEVYRLPETFTIEDTGYLDRMLLANTGCWICKFDRPWRKEEDENGDLKVFFTINDRIRRREDKRLYVIDDIDGRLIDGPFKSLEIAEMRLSKMGSDKEFTIRSFPRYMAEVEPEDWFFSRKVQELGGKVEVKKIREAISVDGLINYVRDQVGSIVGGNCGLFGLSILYSD